MLINFTFWLNKDKRLPASPAPDLKISPTDPDVG